MSAVRARHSDLEHEKSVAATYWITLNKSLSSYLPQNFVASSCVTEILYGRLYTTYLVCTSIDREYSIYTGVPVLMWSQQQPLLQRERSLNRNIWCVEVWELKLYFYQSAGGWKKKKEKSIPGTWCGTCKHPTDCANQRYGRLSCA